MRREVEDIESTRHMRIVVVFLIIASMLTAGFQFIGEIYAEDELTVSEGYVIQFSTVGNAMLDVTETTTEDFTLPHYEAEEGYEFMYAYADVAVAGREAGEHYTWDEFMALTAGDFTQDTEFTLYFHSDNEPDETDEPEDPVEPEEPKEPDPPVTPGSGQETVTETQAASVSVPTVQYNTYGNLRANYVEILQKLNVEDAIVTNTMPNVKLVYGYPGTNFANKMYFFAYHGTVSYGTANRTSTTAAKTKKNSISGKLTLTWPDRAVLSDGTKADVRVIVENVYCNIGKKTSSKISTSDKVYLPIIGSGSNGSLKLLLNTPRTSVANNSDSSTYVTGATCQTRRKVTIKIMRNGYVISRSKYPYMLLGFTDLDVQDHSVPSGKSMETLFNGTYAEGVTLLNGWYSPVVLANKTSTNKAMQSTVNTRKIDSKLNVKGDGKKYKALLDATGVGEDNSTYYGGFIAACQPQSTSFYWYGSNGSGGNSTGTVIAGHPTVSVNGRRLTVNSSGKILTEDGGRMVRLDASGVTHADVSGNNKVLTKTYVMNSSANYKYTPKAGYRVQSLTVDGKAVEFNPEGGVYTFRKLNKNPLPKRDPKTGAILAASASSSYSIEVVFVKDDPPEFVVSKTGDRNTIKVGDSSEIGYTITVNQSRTGAVAGAFEDVDNLAEGCLRVVDGSIVSSVDGAGTGSAELTDSGLKVRYQVAEGETGTFTVNYKATVDWDKFERIYQNAYVGDTSTVTREDALRSIITNVIGDAKWQLDVYADLKLSKVLKGDLRDETKFFELMVELDNLQAVRTLSCTANSLAEIPDAVNGKISTGTDGNSQILIKVRGGGEASISGLPYGTIYRVTEESSDHVASYKVSGDGVSPKIVSPAGENTVNFQRLATGNERVDAYDGDVTVEFTNTKEPATITGIGDSLPPYAVASGTGLLVLAICAGLVFAL